MIKKIIKVLLITFVTLFLIIFYLSIFGIKTNKFNNQITNSILKINKQINLLKITKIFINLQEVVDNLWEDLSYANDRVTIAFAPACASFDQFENFEKRGEFFNQLIFNKIKK